MTYSEDESTDVEGDRLALLDGIGLQIVTVTERSSVKGKERRALDGRTFDLSEAALLLLLFSLSLSPSSSRWQPASCRKFSQGLHLSVLFPQFPITRLCALSSSRPSASSRLARLPEGPGRRLSCRHRRQPQAKKLLPCN